MDLGPAWGAVGSSPLVLGLFALGATLVVTRLYQRGRWAHLSLRGRDPVRRFSGGARSAVMTRAGHRCEHHYLYRWRCRETAHLEADHVHPHSRSGSTTLGNGQVLCKRHNALKAARIPFTWELRRLATLRRGYFPLGVDTAVVRRGSGPSPRGEPSGSHEQRPEAVIGVDADVAPAESGPEFVAPNDVLTMWLEASGIDLPVAQRSAFLAHPAMSAITGHDRAHIEAEMRHHQKLAELAHALETACHHPEDTQSAGQAIAGRD